MFFGQGALVQVRLVVVAIHLLAPHVASARTPAAGTAGGGPDHVGHLSLANELIANDPDSALVHALEAAKQLDRLGTTEEKARVLMMVGDAHAATSDMPAALAAYQRAQLMVEEAPEEERALPALVLARSDIQSKIGTLHFHLRNLDKSIACYNDALRIFDEAHDELKQEELAMRKVRLFKNIAGVYIQRSDFATALPYFQQAVEMNRPLKDGRNEGSLNNNIGICHMEMGRYDLADENFLKALAVRKELGDQRGQAQVLNNLGKNQVNFGNFRAARDHFANALALGRRIGSRESMVISL
jgi:tetratricopeptide (TPR) repeat protein